MIRSIGGLWSGHDCSFCILKDGRPTIHAEYERYIREKEPKGDSVKFMFDVSWDDAIKIDAFVSSYPKKLLSEYESINMIGDNVRYFGHHKSHAAHAFFSSNILNALIITIDRKSVV